MGVTIQGYSISVKPQNLLALKKYLKYAVFIMEQEGYTVSETAKLLGIKKARVHQLINVGTIKVTKHENRLGGYYYLISPEELEKARHRKTQPGPAAADQKQA